MRIKVLFYQHIEVIGGTETYLLRLLPRLKNKGIEAAFYCTETTANKKIVGFFSSKLADENIPVTVCKARSAFSIKNLKTLSKTIKEGGYNVISIHLIHAEIATVLAKILFGIKSKLIVTKHGYQQNFNATHGLDFSKINKVSIRYLAEKMIQSFISGNIAVSHGMAQFYIKSGIAKKDKVVVIHHGIDLNYCNDATPVRVSKNQIIVVARLVKFKGHPYLLRAIKELKENYKDFKLLIVGTGEEKNNLEKLINEYSINEWVNFIGFTDKASNYVSGSDIVIVPSVAEAFGLVVLEAYCCKKPVISFNVPALNEIIVNGETGFLIEDFNIKDMADKVQFLLQNKQKAMEYGENGYNLIKQKFTFEATTVKTIEYYERIFTGN